MRISDWSSDVCSSDLPILLSGHQELTPSLRLKADVIYKRGDMQSVRGLLADRPITTRGLVVDNEFETFGVAPTLEAEIGGAWTARLTGFYGTDKTYGVTQNFTNDVEARSIRIFDNRGVSGDAGIDGPLFTRDRTGVGEGKGGT